GPRDAHAADGVAGRARDVAPLEEDGARRRLHEARQAVHQRGLAGAVGSDDAQDLAAPEAQVDAAQRRQAAEALDDPARLEEKRRHQVTRCARASARSRCQIDRREPLPRSARRIGTSPRGAKTTKTTMRTPRTLGWSSMKCDQA